MTPAARPAAQRPFPQLHLEAADTAARARLGAARHRQMRDGTGRGPGPVVHLVMGGERGVDHNAHEQMQHAPAAPGPPEQTLTVHQRPGMPVDFDRQTGTSGEQLPHRHLPPAQQLVLHHGARLPVHPAADRDPDPERAPPGRLGEQRGEPLGGPRQHPPGIGPFMLQLPPDQHPAAQIQQRHGGVRHRHMHPAHHEPGVVQLDRHMRPAHPARAARRRGLPDQPEPGEPRTVLGHRRGGEAGQPRHRTARHRAVLQHGPQHGTGTGAPPVALGGAGHGGDKGGRRTAGHGEPSSGPEPVHRKTGKDEAARHRVAARPYPERRQVAAPWRRRST